MKNVHSMLLCFFIFVAGCSSTPSGIMPTPPTQLPTTVEYIGTKTNDQILAKWSEVLEFQADADASDVIVTFTDSVTGEEITDGSYGTATIDGVNITIEAPDTWIPNAQSQLGVSFTLPGDASISLEGNKDEGASDVIGSDNITVTPDPNRAEAMTFDSALFYEDASDPNIDIYDGRIYSCFRSLEDTRSIYLAVSDWDRGNKTVYGPVFSGSTYYSCIVKAAENYIVIISRKSGGRSDPRGTYDVFKSSRDGGTTFSDEIPINSDVLSNSRTEAVIDENLILHVISSIDGSKEIYACTTTSCGDATAIAEGTAAGTSGAPLSSALGIAYVGNGAFQVVFSDNRDSATYPDVRLVELTYDGSSYALTGDHKISDATAMESVAWSAAIAMDRNGNSIVTWIYIDAVTFSSNIYMATFDTTEKTVGGEIKVNDIDESLLPVLPAILVDLSNVLHVIYLYYGTFPDYANGGVRYTMGNVDGVFIDSKDIAIENFDYQTSTIRYDTSDVGRAYIIDDTPVYSGGSLVASDIYVIMGTKPSPN